MRARGDRTAASHHGVNVLTLRQAADQLGITPDTLRQGIYRGAIRARKVGTAWTVTQHEVDRYRRGSLGRHGRGPRMEQLPMFPET
jgi:excisionase family DNA binding protein